MFNLRIELGSEQYHDRPDSRSDEELPEVQSIWIFGPTDHPQVMTRAHPALTGLSEQDYLGVPRSGSQPCISAASTNPYLEAHRQYVAAILTWRAAR